MRCLIENILFSSKSAKVPRKSGGNLNFGKGKYFIKCFHVSNILTELLSIFVSSKHIFSFTKIEIMKYFILVMLFSLGSFSTSFAQGKKTAPAAVQAAFDAKFPTVQKAKWDLEEGEWEAEFKMNGKEMSANFKADGTWLETETEINTADLPQAIKNLLASQFANYKIDEATAVEIPGQPLTYEVELEKGKTTIEVLFSADGTMLGQKSDSEEEDGDDSTE